jgi:hypothetical protein
VLLQFLDSGLMTLLLCRRRMLPLACYLLAGRLLYRLGTERDSERRPAELLLLLDGILIVHRRF